MNIGKKLFGGIMVVITNIQNDKFDSSEYSNFCIDTERYCDKYNIPIKILTEDKPTSKIFVSKCI